MSGKTPFNSHQPTRDELELARLAHFKQRSSTVGTALGPAMIDFFKHSVSKRQTKFSKIGACWGQLVPETLVGHCALESLNRGTLTVIVDSSPHLYELKQLLLCGLQQQILLACASTGLKKIALKQGRWYDGAAGDDRRIRFQ